MGGGGGLRGVGGRERETETQRERQTGRERERDRQTDRQRHRQTDRERRFVLSCAYDAHILQHETCGRQGVDWGGWRHRERD